MESKGEEGKEKIREGKEGDCLSGKKTAILDFPLLPLIHFYQNPFSYFLSLA